MRGGEVLVTDGELQIQQDVIDTVLKELETGKPRHERSVYEGSERRGSHLSTLESKLMSNRYNAPTDEQFVKVQDAQRDKGKPQNKSPFRQTQPDRERWRMNVLGHQPLYEFTQSRENIGVVVLPSKKRQKPKACNANAFV